MYDYDIFLSHSSEDNVHTRLLRGYFRSHNLLCWYDNNELRKTALLDDRILVDTLKANIEKCRHFLVVVSPSTQTSSWVKLEVEHARRLYANGKIEGLAAIVIEPTPLDGIPEWLKAIRWYDITDRRASEDRLEELRNEIGKSKPTYIREVNGTFIKLIPIKDLDNDIEISGTLQLKLLFINGGFTIRNYLVPAIQQMLRNRQDIQIDIQVIFLDDPKLYGYKSDQDYDLARETEFLNNLFRRSNFLTNPAPHEDSVRDAITCLEQLGPKCSLEVRVTKRLPAFRMVIAGKFGFVGPYMQGFDNRIPFFSFDDLGDDRSKTFHTKAERYFEELWSSPDTRILNSTKTSNS